MRNVKFRERKFLSSTIIRLVVPICVLVLCSFPSLAFAQQADSASNAKILIDLLEDETARNALINDLREIASASASVSDLVPDPEEERLSFSRRVAQLTSEFVEATAASLSSALLGLGSVASLFRGLDSDQLSMLADAIIALAVVFGATTVSYFSLRFFAKKFYRNMGNRSDAQDFIKVSLVLVLTVLVDAGVVVLSWGLGYLAALYLHGDPGTIGVRQSLYLNAFLLVGLVRVVFRAVLSPSTQELRLINISDDASRNISFWLGTIATLVGYGQLFLVPIINRQASFTAGRGVSTLLAFFAIGIALSLILKNRKSVSRWLLMPDAEHKPMFVRTLISLWYLPVALYLIALAVIVAARPDGLVWPVLLSTLQVIGVVVSGIVASSLLSRFMSRGVNLPASVSGRMPLLQARTNSLLTKITGALRIVILILVAGFSLDFLNIFDFGEFLSGDLGRRIVSVALSVTLIVLFGFMFWLTLVSWIDYRLNPEYGLLPSSREKTLLTLLRNAATIAFTVIILMFALSEIGLDIAPLIASAGVLGLAIGFGAQKLVQDIITGIFIQFENAINVGDVVTLSGTTGTAEKLTIRSVTLRDVNGTVHLIPFSSVDMVSNYVRDFSYFVCDMGIAYRENIDDARDAMMKAFNLLQDSDHRQFIQGDLEWFGVQALGDSAVVLRARIKCSPGKQWAIGRAYNELCKNVLDECGIEIPYPHQTIYFGENKDGTAPALHLKSVLKGG